MYHILPSDAFKPACVLTSSHYILQWRHHKRYAILKMTPSRSRFLNRRCLCSFSAHEKQISCMQYIFMNLNITNPLQISRLLLKEQFGNDISMNSLISSKYDSLKTQSWNGEMIFIVMLSYFCRNERDRSILSVSVFHFTKPLTLFLKTPLCMQPSILSAGLVVASTMGLIF